MKGFLADKLSIQFNGIWEVKEIIAAVVLAAVTVLVVLALIQLAKVVVRRVNPRKSTIFSHRKNRYKNSIGKKKNF